MRGLPRHAHSSRRSSNFLASATAVGPVASKEWVRPVEGAPLQRSHDASCGRASPLPGGAGGYPPCIINPLQLNPYLVMKAMPLLDITGPCLSGPNDP